MKMVSYDRETPLKVGVWLGSGTSHWMGEVVECGPKRVRLRAFGSLNVKQMTRDEVERQIVGGGLLSIVEPDSADWKDRARVFREAALLSIAKMMRRYDLNSVMILPGTLLPSPAVIGQDSDGETYTLLL